MNTGIYFPLSASLFSILLLISFFSKKHIRTTETTLFSILIVTNFLGLIIELLCTFAAYIHDDFTILSDFILKLYLVYIITWAGLFTVYVYHTTGPEKQKLNKKVLMILYLVLVVTIFALPIDLVIKDNFATRYTIGESVNFTYIISAIMVTIMLILMIMNYKQLKSKKHLPLFLFLLLGTGCMTLQMLNPSLLLITYMETFIMFVMYFTIENPDLKMLEELYKNKKIIEKNNENTSNFLFKISQSIKNPVKQIIEKTSNNGELIEINNLGKELEYAIDDVLDVTKMTTKSLKLYTSRYNPRNLFNEVKYRAENNLNKNIKLEYKISPNIPNYVYGDSIKLKQVLSSILENSIDHTEEGFIEFEVNTIIKYGICRFIIDITDSGKGISIDKVNDILSLEESMEKIDDEQVTFNLKEVKAIVEKLGGSFMVKSDEDSGTTVSITIDQKIVETKDEELTKKLEVYEESLYGNKKIMVIDDDAKELSEIINFFEKNNVVVHGSLFGKDIIEKISNKHRYDLIILDDETNTGSALSTLQELKKNEKFNIPVVVMLNDNKEFIKLHYLKDGFADTISKSKLKDELERILKRF